MNMNLMFYDFNGSSLQPPQQNSTGTNFYQSNGGCSTTNNNVRPNYINNQGATGGAAGPSCPNQGSNGDRVPTRERGYRSANHYARRRQGLPIGINNGGIADQQ